MSDEKMYLAQWKDQEKFPDFEPILIEILEKLEKQEQELQKTREQLDIAEAVLSVQVTDSALAYFKDKQGE